MKTHYLYSYTQLSCLSIFQSDLHPLKTDQYVGFYHNNLCLIFNKNTKDLLKNTIYNLKKIN